MKALNFGKEMFRPEYQEVASFSPALRIVQTVYSCGPSSLKSFKKKLGKHLWQTD